MPSFGAPIRSIDCSRDKDKVGYSFFKASGTFPNRIDELSSSFAQKVGMAESELHHAAAEVSEALPPRDCWAVARGGVLVHEQYGFSV